MRSRVVIVAAMIWGCLSTSSDELPAAFAQELPAVPAAPPGVAEDRIRALEDQNRRLAAEVHEIRMRLVDAGGETRVGATESPETGASEGAGHSEHDFLGGTINLRDGLQFTSRDERFRIEFHDLTQVEGRFFSPTGDPLHDTFDIPRQRLYFSGQVEKYFEFYSVLNRGYGTFDVLDAYINFKFDKAFTIRFGRTKTPFNYEYYKIGEGDLIAPERSVFTGNLSTNRQVGVMAYGKVLDERLEYAAGLFNGPRRSFQDFNDAKTPFLFLNARPFLKGENDVLRHLAIGGSGNYGLSKNPLEPIALRTANDETTTDAVATVSPAFLVFNPAARQVGAASFWSGDVAWFYHGLTMLSMYNGGYITYSLPGKSGIQVPYTGWSVALTYFLTGEEPTARNGVEPLRPFRFHDPINQPGAVEPYFRVSTLNAGSNVFDSGLADPALWSREAVVCDTGVNWYPNRYVRFFLDWQYSQFGKPVRIGPDRMTRSINLFWIRSQIYY